MTMCTGSNVFYNGYVKNYAICIQQFLIIYKGNVIVDSEV